MLIFFADINVTKTCRVFSFWFLQVLLKLGDTKIMKKADRKKNVYLIFYIATVAEHYNGRAWRLYSETLVSLLQPVCGLAVAFRP